MDKASIWLQNLARITLIFVGSVMGIGMAERAGHYIASPSISMRFADASLFFMIAMLFAILTVGLIACIAQMQCNQWNNSEKSTTYLKPTDFKVINYILGIFFDINATEIRCKLLLHVYLFVILLALINSLELSIFMNVFPFDRYDRLSNFFVRVNVGLATSALIWSFGLPSLIYTKFGGKNF